jgi:hypothetical protein
MLAAAAVATMLANPAAADSLNGYKVVATINGATALNVHGGGPNVPASSSAPPLTQGGVTLNLSVNANQFAAAKASATGTGAANALVRSTTAFDFVLTGPGAARAKGGKLLMKVALEGTVSGDADLHLVGSLELDSTPRDASVTASIKGGTPREEVDLVVDISPYSNGADLKGRVRLVVDATARLAGGANATSSAESTQNTKVTGFRVLDSAGAQVTGFTMTGSGGVAYAELGAGPVGGAKAVAVEFYNAGFKHYFVTANSVEIAKLDNGTFAGWARTGKAFNVGTAAGPGLVPVCRFFTVAFPPTSSHFYAPRGLGCEGTLTDAKWQYEGEVFFMALPDATGKCPSGFAAVFRLFNNMQGGAPNHRLTTDDATRTQMLAAGYVAEGAGIGVGMCSPQ